MCFYSPQMDINEMTHPWGLEVDRVELTFGSLLKAPEQGQAATLTTPASLPSAPGLEGLTDSIQQLAMHFLSHSGSSHPKQGKIKHSDVSFFMFIFFMFFLCVNSVVVAVLM